MQNRNPARHSMRGPVLWLVVLMIHGASVTGLMAQTVPAADPSAIGDSKLNPGEPNLGKPNPNKPCVLLRNGNVLFGAATKIGDRVSITRDDGSTISLAGDQVEATGGSLIELYEHRKSNRFQGDLYRYHADVRWCLRNGLVRQAAADILHARSLAPSDPQTIQLLGLVATRMKEASSPARGAAVDRTAESVRPVSYETTETIGVFDQPLNDVPSDGSQHGDARANLSGADRGAATPALLSSHPNQASGGIQVSEATTHDFSTRVQPILLNRCVRCHHKDVDDARGFTLRSSQELKWAPKLVSAENLRSVLKHVNLKDPLTSVIRERAIDGHGGRRNTFGSSGSAMLGNLDRWLSSLQASRVATPWEAAMDQHIAEDASLEQGVAPELVSVDGDDPALRNMIPRPPRTREIDASESSAGANGPRKMRRMPKVENPFDPELFNRRFHGG